MSGATVSWSSSNSDVLTINSSGLATGVAAGTATISATSGTASASASVSVIPILSSASALLGFSFIGSANPALQEDAIGQIENGNVTVLIPAEIDATQLIAAFT